jgi:hypothetical protein
MNAWEAPELTDLKATPAPVRRARNTFDLLGEEDAARAPFASEAVLTEQRVLDGQLVDVITGSPPPIRRQASPTPDETTFQSALGDVSLADPAMDDDGDIYDPLFDAWTVEPAVQRDEASPDPRRLALLLVGIAAVALVAIGVALTSGSPSDGPSVDMASAPVERAVAPPPVDLEPLPDPAPPATPAPPETPDPVTVAKAPAVVSPPHVVPEGEAAAPSEEPSDDAPGVEASQTSVKAPPQVDRSTMYTPSEEPAVAVEIAELSPPPMVEPERPQPPPTTGTQPWGASAPSPPVQTSGTNPWGVQE